MPMDFEAKENGHMITETPPVLVKVEITTFNGKDDFKINSTCKEYVTVNGSDHLYSGFEEKIYPEFEDKACQTEMTSHDIEALEDDIMRLEAKLNDKVPLLRESFCEVILKNDENINKYTGIPTSEQLHEIFDIINEAEPNPKYWSGASSTSTNVNYQQAADRKKTGPNRKLTKFNEYIFNPT